MTKPMIRIHDSNTNEIIDREMNDVEFAEYEQRQIETQEKLDLMTAKASEKAALLAKLGITANEAALLLS